MTPETIRNELRLARAVLDAATEPAEILRAERAVLELIDLLADAVVASAA